MAKDKEKPQAQEIPGLRITTDAEHRVSSGGRDWAGISEVPLHWFSAAQLLELKADKRLTVEEITVNWAD